MNGPTISVIIPTYNGAALVRETIDSVLAQSYEAFEIVVVDDCSKDDTVAVLSAIDDRRLRILTTPHNLGPVGARNLAVAHARGQYFAALDQDDLCHPMRFARQVGFLEANPGVAAVGTATRTLTASRLQPGRYPARTSPGFMRWLLHAHNPLVWSSMMIRGSAARQLQPFSRLEYQFAEDYDLYHRLAELGDIARLDEVLLTYRSHGAGASQRYRARMSSSAKAVLERVYAPWLGDAAERYARLMVTHIAAGEPVASEEDLQGLTAAMRAVDNAFQTRHRLSPEDCDMISAEMSGLWWRAASSSIRSGHLNFRTVRENRPEFAEPRGLSDAERMSTSVVGWLRRRSVSAQEGWQPLAV